jgi:8-oxo-dGTP pyrophosphatase MutT (NUDIX family)
MVIEKDGKFLLVQEGHAGAYGLWNWQQGKVEEGETIEEAAVREAKEETGYEVSILEN